MTVDEQQGERRQPDWCRMSLLVDVGSAWTKAAAVARSRGRWRIVSHVAQPAGWGEEELRAALAGRLAPVADPRVAEHIAELLRRRAANRMPHPAAAGPRPGGRLAELSGTPRDGRQSRRAGALWRPPRRMMAARCPHDWRPCRPPRSTCGCGRWIRRGPRRSGARNGGPGGRGAWRSAAAGDLGGQRVADRPRSRCCSRMAPSQRRQPSARRPRREPGPLRHLLEELLQRMVEPGGVRQLTPVSLPPWHRRAGAVQMRRILGIDLGAHYLTWVTADEAGAAESRVFADGGSRRAAGRARRSEPPVAACSRWPSTSWRSPMPCATCTPGRAPIPQTDDELAVIHAAARYLLAQAAGDAASRRDSGPPGRRGRTIAAAPRPAQAAQLLLDGVRPVGVTQLAIDSAGALPPLGSLMTARSAREWLCCATTCWCRWARPWCAAAAAPATSRCG